VASRPEHSWQPPSGSVVGVRVHEAGLTDPTAGPGLRVLATENGEAFPEQVDDEFIGGEAELGLHRRARDRP
jgi:hypothetical protein